MNCARNCENLFNFVKVIPKTLLVPFFSGHGVITYVWQVWAGCLDKLFAHLYLYCVQQLCTVIHIDTHMQVSNSYR